MDWNKSNSIFVIAFIVLNIFLASSVYLVGGAKNYNSMEDKEFINDVKSLLEQKNIFLNCDIPYDEYTIPILETEYEIINVNNNFIYEYLGENINAVEDVYIYENSKGEKLQVKDRKKIILTSREYKSGKIDENKIDNFIELFIKEKNIDMSEYQESYRYISESEGYVLYTFNHNGFSIENSYICFYIDTNGVYKYESQIMLSKREIKGKVNVNRVIEELPKLLSYSDVENKEIIKIELVYYSLEDENWEYVTKTNSDPVWKIIFSDGSDKKL